MEKHSSEILVIVLVKRANLGQTDRQMDTHVQFK